MRFLSVCGGGGDGITWYSKAFDAWPKTYLELKDVKVPKKCREAHGPRSLRKKAFPG